MVFPIAFFLHFFKAAQNAGMDCIVITTQHTKEELSGYGNVVGFIEDYNDDLLKHLNKS